MRSLCRGCVGWRPFFPVTIFFVFLCRAHVLLLVLVFSFSAIIFRFSFLPLYCAPETIPAPTATDKLTSLSSFLHNPDFCKSEYFLAHVALWDGIVCTTLIRCVAVTSNGTFVVPKVGKAAVCVNPGPDYTIDLRYVRRAFLPMPEPSFCQLESICRC